MARIVSGLCRECFDCVGNVSIVLQMPFGYGISIWVPIIIVTNEVTTVVTSYNRK